MSQGNRCIEALLVDWWDTLEASSLSQEDILEGARCGLRALGLSDVDVHGLQEQFVEYRREYPDRVEDEFRLDEVTQECFARHGIDLSSRELETYLQASQEYWRQTHHFEPGARQFLFDARALGLKTALVSNDPTPGRFLRPIFVDHGFEHLLDAMVFSSEVGKRKPHAAIFRRALDRLGVPPAQAVFVGDLLYEDIKGASSLGMLTIQATWLRDDGEHDDVRPTKRAESFADAIRIIRDSLVSRPTGTF